MLKFFKRKKPLDDDLVRRRPLLEELSWPLMTKIRLAINPFAGRVFFHDIICMVAKMASIDGPVNEVELRAFTELLEREFALGRKQVKKARGILFEAHRSKKEFADFAREFYRYFRNQPAVLENALDVLLAMAYSDNVFSLGEQRLMAEAAEIFKVDTRELTRLVKRYHKRHSVIERPGEERRKRSEGRRYTRQERTEKRDERKGSGRSETPRPRQWFEVLGCTPFDSPSAVKRRYRELVLAYHPDKLPPGIPDVMKRASTERFLEIQRAYEAYELSRIG